MAVVGADDGTVSRITVIPGNEINPVVLPRVKRCYPRENQNQGDKDFGSRHHQIHMGTGIRELNANGRITRLRCVALDSVFLRP